MRLASPVHLAAAYRPSFKSKVSTHTEEHLVETHFSQDFLGFFIEAPTSGSLMKRAGLSDARTADPFIKQKADTLAITLIEDYVARKPYSVQNDLRLILAFREVKKAPWWHWKLLLEGLKSLFSTTKKIEVGKKSDSRLANLERAKARLEKLIKEVEALHEKHLHNAKRIDPEVRTKDHEYYLSAKDHIQKAYNACLAEIELAKESEGVSDADVGAAIFMEAYEIASHSIQPLSFSGSRVNEERLITEGAEEDETSLLSSASPENNQIISRISTSSTPYRERLTTVGAFEVALEKLKAFLEGVKLKSPAPGFVKKVYDFVHHEGIAEAVAAGSAAAHMASPGSGYLVNCGATIAKSAVKGIMHSDASFRKIEYENAFRTQLRNNIDFAIKEVDMFGTSEVARTAALMGAGMAASAVSTSMQSSNDAILNKLEVIEANQRKQEETQRKLAQDVAPLLERARTVSMGATSTALPIGQTYSRSPSPITENMQAGQSLRTQSTSPEVQRPITPELERLQKLEEENKALNRKVEGLASTLNQVNAQLRESQAAMKKQEEGQQQTNALLAQIAAKLQ